MAIPVEPLKTCFHRALWWEGEKKWLHPAPSPSPWGTTPETSQKLRKLPFTETLILFLTQITACCLRVLHQAYCLFFMLFLIFIFFYFIINFKIIFFILKFKFARMKKHIETCRRKCFYTCAYIGVSWTIDFSQPSMTDKWSRFAKLFTKTASAVPVKPFVELKQKKINGFTSEVKPCLMGPNNS
jgi:hypothetical protein